MAITKLQRWSHLGGMPAVSQDYNGKKQCVLYVSTAVIVVTLFALSFSFPVSVWDKDRNYLKNRHFFFPNSSLISYLMTIACNLVKKNLTYAMT
jgi:hypothetical protein